MSLILEEGDGFPESRMRGGGPFGTSASLIFEEGGGPIDDDGGVERVSRFDIVGEKGGSDLFVALYWLIPDHSLPSAETVDMVPVRPFIVYRSSTDYIQIVWSKTSRHITQCLRFQSKLPIEIC